MKNEKHLAYIRTLPCIVCFAPGEPHHIRTRWSAGVGIKSSDILTLPLCREHHSELHNIGEMRFWGEKGINCFEQILKIIINKDSTPF